ncbi:MAG: hydrogenase expression/formation protein HypE [Paramuribaculum sp.]|nr:hydrogenase expression/formation protein HypE [Paramuribaculum sp.]
MTTCPIPDKLTGTVELAHGGGGSMTARLIERVFAERFHNAYLDKRHDGAVMPQPEERIAMSTDSFVVKPLFFPGGNIGDLAVNGTANDLLCCGATPRYLSVAFIIEEGMPISQLEEIAESMAQAAKEAEVEIVTGDTKVVEHGKCDGLYINTTGVGIMPPDLSLDPVNLNDGDTVILTGQIAAHGMAVMSQREGLSFKSPIKSDTASLGDIVHALLDCIPAELRVLRDPTRGGLSSTLNELAEASQHDIEIEDEAIPIDKTVASACEILGLDPLYVANEGIMVAVVAPEAAETALAAIRRSAHGHEAKIIGHVKKRETDKPRVLLRLPAGNRRIVEMMSGEQLPRIC